jgi:hypothetical protein
MLIELTREGRDYGDLDAREEIAAILIVVSVIPKLQLCTILVNNEIQNSTVSKRVKC